MNREVSQKGWTRIDYQPAISNHSPLLVLQHVQPGSTVLDVGCNKGSDSLFLTGHGFRVLGIDINRTAIEEARIRAQELSVTASADFRVANILEEPFTDKFDVVLLIRVLTCFSEYSEWHAVLRRTVQLLKAHGYVYIHDFLASPEIEAYRVRYETGARLGWRAGNFQVNDSQGNQLFIAHHHSLDEVALITASYESLSYRSHESLSMNGNVCRMFEFLGRSKT
ncbi:MAG: class I SAM-dependent methyltransferase [Candidatus Sulfotelmatobacter sp.]